jgi:hypothetical protein
VRESGVPVFLLRVAGPGDAQTADGRDDGIGQQIAHESGGREFVADGTNTSRVCRSIAYALKNHYTLTYSTEVGPPDRALRRIEVLVPSRDCVIHARRSHKLGAVSSKFEIKRGPADPDGGF